MTHISEIIEDILVEWAYRVHDGMPNPKNTEHIQELRESMEELNLPNNVIYQVIQNLINEQQQTIKGTGPTQKAKKAPPLSDAGKKEAEKLGLIWKGRGYGKEGETGITHKNDGKGNLIPIDKKSDTQQPETDTEPKRTKISKDGKLTKKGDDKEKDTEGKPKSKADSQREKIGGKTYSEPAETSDEDFKAKNTDNQTTTTFKMPESVLNNPKIPKKYTQFIERVLNTQQNVKDKNNKSSYYGLGKVGKGDTDSQAGELLSMMATTMRRKERDEFFKALDEHLSMVEASSEKTYVSRAWVKAAKENSSAILRMMYDKYGDDYEIVAGAWDVKEEFEALGFDYGEKGDSTDMIVAVKVGDTIIKEEVSLKQSLKNQRLWNGTLGSAFESGLLPQHLEQGKGTVNQFEQNQIKNIDNFFQTNQTNIGEYLKNIGDNPDFDKILKKVANDMDTKPKNQDIIINQFNDFLAQYKKDLAENPDLVLDRDYIAKNLKTSKKRNVDKISIILGRMMTESGDELGINFVEQQKEIAKEHAREVANFINGSDEAKNAVLKKVQEKLPLKSVSDGSENIVLGEYVISKKTMKAIFGTDDWNQVVEQLKVNPDADPPMIEYRAKIDGQDKVIPITTIGIREDGEGYGGKHKFEMKVAPDFDKIVANASQDIYGDQEPIKFPNTPAADLRR